MEPTKITFEDVVAGLTFDAAEDEDRELYAWRVLYLNSETGERRSVVLFTTYDLTHLQRTIARLSAKESFLLSALRKEYPRACPLHWAPIGGRIVRLAEIPF